MSKITASVDFDRVKDDELKRFLSLFAEQVVSLINNGLSFADNFSAKTVSVTFSAVDTDTAIAHGLGRAPSGYIVTGKSAAMVIYNGATSNTTNLLYLRSTVAGTASVLVF